MVFFVFWFVVLCCFLKRPILYRSSGNILTATLFGVWCWIHQKNNRKIILRLQHSKKSTPCSFGLQKIIHSKICRRKVCRAACEFFDKSTKIIAFIYTKGGGEICAMWEYFYVSLGNFIIVWTSLVHSTILWVNLVQPVASRIQTCNVQTSFIILTAPPLYMCSIVSQSIVMGAAAAATNTANPWRYL